MRISFCLVVGCGAAGREDLCGSQKKIDQAGRGQRPFHHCFNTSWVLLIQLGREKAEQ